MGSNLSNLPRTIDSFNFSEGDLRNVNFTGSELASANFSKADLTGARFDGANLSYANFFGAKGLDIKNVTAKRMCDVILPDGHVTPSC